MITEIVLGGLFYYGLNKFNHRAERHITEGFKTTMLKAGIKNSEDETFELKNLKGTKYGATAIVDIPEGLDFKKLSNTTSIIQDNFGCLIEIEKERFENYAMIKFIYNPLNNIKFNPIKTYSHQLFLGYKLDGEPYLLDLNKDPHVLISGKTGVGKSFLLASILTNLIYYNSKDIELYLFQIMKGEIDIFKNCKPVKFISNDEKDIAIVLKKITEIINKRSKRFAEKGIKNITQWNKHYPRKKMKRIIIVGEEVSFFMNNQDDKDNPFFKSFIDIVKAGRSAGIHLIALTQRTTVANLGGNGELKSQMTVVSGTQRNGMDSKNAIDIEGAKDLEIQEYICSGNDGYTWFKCPDIDEDFDILHQYVPEIIIPKCNKEYDKQKIIQKVSWKTPTLQEWNKIKDSIPDITCQEKIKEQPKQEQKNNTFIRKKKSGVISLEDLKK